MLNSVLTPPAMLTLDCRHVITVAAPLVPSQILPAPRRNFPNPRPREDSSEELLHTERRQGEYGTRRRQASQTGRPPGPFQELTPKAQADVL